MWVTKPLLSHIKAALHQMHPVFLCDRSRLYENEWDQLRTYKLWLCEGSIAYLWYRSGQNICQGSQSYTFLYTNTIHCGVSLRHMQQQSTNIRVDRLKIGTHIVLYMLHTDPEHHAHKYFHHKRVGSACRNKHNWRCITWCACETVDRHKIRGKQITPWHAEYIIKLL